MLVYYVLKLVRAFLLFLYGLDGVLALPLHHLVGLQAGGHINDALVGRASEAQV